MYIGSYKHAHAHYTASSPNFCRHSWLASCSISLEESYRAPSQRACRAGAETMVAAVTILTAPFFFIAVLIPRTSFYLPKKLIRSRTVPQGLKLQSKQMDRLLAL